MKQWIENINAEWPAFKYLGFGCYYAWIFLCYSSGVLFPAPNSIFGLSSQTVMYLVSTTALATFLILGGLAHKYVAKMVANIKVVLVFAAVASVSTAFVAWGAQTESSPLYWAGCVFTGMGTSVISLRYGMMYSVMGARKALTNVSAAFALAGALYFIVVGVPHELSVVLCVVLPFAAALCTVPFNAARTGKPSRVVVPTKNLPKRFFLKLVVAISTFSAIAGFYNSMGASMDAIGTAYVGAGNAVMVFSVSVVALLLLVVGGAVDRNFDLSRLYYPIIVIACFGIIVAPLLGEYSYVQRTVISATYNVFILFIWCLLAHVANRTDKPPVRVFGFGRGASAVGTTAGWLIYTFLVPNLEQNSDTLMALAVVMVFVLVVLSLVVLKEGTIDKVLSQTGDASTMAVEGAAAVEVAEVAEDLAAGVAENSAVGVARDEGLAAEDALAIACDKVKENFGLSEREREVLMLLAQGKTIEQISRELYISFNTSKSHVRHVYTKTNIHNRKELAALIQNA